MKKNLSIFLNHIVESIEKIERFLDRMPIEQFYVDEKTQSAVFRELEIIGEAIKNLPQDFCKKYPAVPWSDFAKLRDKLIHVYFGVDIRLTFGIATKELPTLKRQILAIKKDLEKK